MFSKSLEGVCIYINGFTPAVRPLPRGGLSALGSVIHFFKIQIQYFFQIFEAAELYELSIQRAVLDSLGNVLDLYSFPAV